VIAEEAGVSNGSLFVYFDTKSKLFNELYLELKLDTGASAISGGFPWVPEIREQFRHVWTRWMGWQRPFPKTPGPRAVGRVRGQ
jgi:AcrR family transcriptional regulator